MDSPVCTELAFAATHRGHPTLRFNYRGVGASQGSASLETCLDDARAAFTALTENVGHDSVVLAGYDYGAEVAMELALTGTKAAGIALIAPVTSRFDFRRMAQLQMPVVAVAAHQDAMTDRALLSELCQGTGDEFVVIPGADHVFSVGLTAVGRSVAAFLEGERAEDALDADADACEPSAKLEDLL
jgi:alpha/beta superfamily hydrolase